MKYSARESDILALIPTDGRRITTHQLVEQHYGPEPPLNARVILVSRLRGIAQKAERSKANWRLCKSGRHGPRPMEFWIEPVHPQT